MISDMLTTVHQQ